MTFEPTAAPVFAGPLYKQVAAMLRLKICASEWTPRAPLPNEVALARDAGVSIGTMRKALELLESEHLIERRQGRGTFVVETSADTEVERFSNLVLGGQKVKANTVKWLASEGAASKDEASRLQVREGAGVYRFEGVWRADRGLAVLEQVTVLQGRFPDLPARVIDAGQFLFPVYRKHYNEVIGSVSEEIMPAECDAETAARLRVPEGATALKIERVAIELHGSIVEFARRTIVPGEARYIVNMT